MPTDDPIVYRYTGDADQGEGLTGIPGRSLHQSDVDGLDADAKARLKAHLAGEHRHIYRVVEAASAEAEAEPEPEPAKSSKAARAGSEK